mmetsp:Transcript_42788/g.50164  ORF Transcript_42788/g.50164 Transcript_42788/m.50164 type:complete len:84 (+) Transcript_42788:366-617(+)
MFGSKIFPKIGWENLWIVQTLEERRFLFCMGFYLIGNMLRHKLMTTGAFEIYFDDKLVYSKLHSDIQLSHELIDSLCKMYKIY